MTTTDEQTVTLVSPGPGRHVPAPRSHPPVGHRSSAPTSVRPLAATAQPIGAQPFGTQPFGTRPAFDARPAGLAPGGVPLPVAPARRPVALIVIAVAAVLVVVVGGVLASVFVFGGAGTVDGPAVEREIVRTTRDAVRVTPTDVHCPVDVAIAAGGSFTCVATLDSQPITYTVTQVDDRGSVRFAGQRVLRMADVESTGADIIGRQVGEPVRLDCRPAGATVLVNDVGTPVTCLATRAADATDTASFVLTVAEDQTVTVRLAS